jgi:hypothetical protein
MDPRNLYPVAACSYDDDDDTPVALPLALDDDELPTRVYQDTPQALPSFLLRTYESAPAAPPPALEDDELPTRVLAKLSR